MMVSASAPEQISALMTVLLSAEPVLLEMVYFELLAAVLISLVLVSVEQAF